jgi:hypothetical protein
MSGVGIDLCWERWSCLLLLGGTTSVSSAKDAKKSDNIISFWNIPDDCHVISKVPAVDTEVDPPQQFSPANVDEPILTYCKKPCASAPLREIILFARRACRAICCAQ